MPRPPMATPPKPARQFAMRSPASSITGPLSTVGEADEQAGAQQWQVDAYNYAQVVGEVGYVLEVKANLIGQCRLIVEQRQPNSDQWSTVDDPRCQRVTQALKGAQGGQRAILVAGCKHIEIAGDAYLFGTPVVDEAGQPAGLLWEMLSILEVEVGKDGKTVRHRNGKSGGGKKEAPPPENAYVARFHNPALSYSSQSDSAVRRVIPILKELVLLTQVIEAVAKSRLSAAMLYVPWEFSFGPVNEFEEPGDAQLSFDEMEEELRNHLNAPIEDRSAASSLLPLLMRGPGVIEKNGHAYPAKDLVGIVDLARDLDGLYKELRQEALDRLAAGMAIPPEVMTGKSVLSGLGGGKVAESIDQDLLGQAIATGSEVVDFLTTAYLRPMLTVFEGMDPADAEWFRFGLDTSPITADPDLSAPATVGYQLDELSGEAWRRANNFDDEDAPDEQEQFQRVMLKLLLAQPTLGPAILPLLYPGQPGLQDAIRKWVIGQSAPGGAQAPPQLALTQGNGHSPTVDELVDLLSKS